MFLLAFIVPYVYRRTYMVHNIILSQSTIPLANFYFLVTHKSWYTLYSVILLLSFWIYIFFKLKCVKYTCAVMLFYSTFCKFISLHLNVFSIKHVTLRPIELYTTHTHTNTHAWPTPDRVVSHWTEKKTNYWIVWLDRLDDVSGYIVHLNQVRALIFN